MPFRIISVISLIVASVMATLLVFGVVAYVWRVELLTWLEAYVTTTVTEHDAAQAALKPHIPSTTEIIAAANPAVVSVVVTKDVPIYERYYEQVRPFGFFGGSIQVPRIRESGTEAREVGGGSGFIVSTDGLIVTNRHVVADTTARYSILMNDGTAHAVQVLARDTDLDIALLQPVEPPTEPLPFLTFGDSDTLQLGEPVIAIGNALSEFTNSASAGIVSGLARTIVARDNSGQGERLDSVIQTDAAINPGNSGGPLLNQYGEVIGVNVATSQGADNISFALPAKVVREFVDSITNHNATSS